MAMVGSTREPVVSSFIAWGDPLTDPKGSLGQLHFDVVMTEDHERTTEVTEHSVEQGVAIVDHVRPNVNKLRLEVFISNTPIYNADFQLNSEVIDVDAGGEHSFLAGGTSALFDRGLQAVGLQAKFPTQIAVQVLTSDGPVDYVQNAYNKMTELRDTATLLSVATPRQFYSNMILETINMHRDAQTGTSATFSLEFRQIRIVSSNIVDAPLPSVPRAVPTIDKGKLDPKKANTPKESLAHFGANFLQQKFGL